MISRRLFSALSLTTLAGLVLGPWRARAAVVPKARTMADLIEHGEYETLYRALKMTGFVQHDGFIWWACGESAVRAELYPGHKAIPLASSIPAPPPSAGPQ